MEQKILRDYTMIYNLIIRTDKLDTYQKSCINNILSNEKNFKISLNILAKRIPCSRDKCIKVINSLKEIEVVRVEKVKTENGDWDSNTYSISLDKLLSYLGVVIEEDNVVVNKDYLVVNKDNGSIPERLGVVVNKDTKNTNKNTNIENKKESSLDSIINTYTTNLELINSLKEFLKMRKSIKKPMTDKAMKLLIIKLDKLGSNDNEKIEILNQSIFYSWQGIFPLKNKLVEGEEVSGTQSVSLDELLGERV